MAGTLGFRLLPSPPRLPGELLERFGGLASAMLADAMCRFGGRAPYIGRHGGCER